MAGVTSLQIGRFHRLGRRSGEVWQVGVFRLPMWIANQDDPSLPLSRGVAVICRSVRTGLVNLAMVESRESDAIADCAVATCTEFALKWQQQLQGRPSTIHVTDRSLAAALEARREQLDAQIVIVPALPEVAEVLLDMEVHHHGSVRPALMDREGISRERVRAFAEAAAAFYRAAP